MKVLISAYACAPNRGTEPGNGWNWAFHLAQLGLDVTVLTRSENREAIKIFFSKHGVSAWKMRFFYVAPNPQRYSAGSVLHYMAWQWMALRQAQMLAREVQFDVVHHVTYGSLVGGSLLWKLRQPFVFGPAGGGQKVPSTMSVYFGKHWRKEWLRSRLIDAVRYSPFHRAMAKNTSLFLATNRETFNFAQQLGAQRVELFLDSGLPIDYYPQKLLNRRYNPGRLRLLWVGKLVPLKALLLALDAIANVRIPVSLTVLGDGPQREQLQGWIRERALEGVVEWRGSIPWLAMRTEYQSHDALLFTSLRDSFGTQLLEAMSQGLPIIVLNLHGARDLVPLEASIKVPVTDPSGTVNALARAIETFYSLPAAAKEAMSYASLAFARQHAWPRKAELMAELYERVLSV